jgi:hypothetical protein
MGRKAGVRKHAKMERTEIVEEREARNERMKTYQVTERISTPCLD